MAANKHIETEGKGVIILPVVIFESPEYISLSSASKVVITALQSAWYPSKVGFTSIGVHQICKKTNLSRKTITKAMSELMLNGWIVLKRESGFKTTRQWELTWLGYHKKRPSNIWKINRNGGEKLPL
ncbi:MAG: hypothetical protein KZQ83_17420 [gamma proteobacterium symbiont of Taylorina sp.]|nr:hypothetical protein [gamma proteobacterium symbiont of Taylorina sp.]